MAETKTKATNASVTEYISSRASAQQLEDCHQLITLLSEVTGQPATMWGPSIVGFGRYPYTYDIAFALLTSRAIRGSIVVNFATT